MDAERFDALLRGLLKQPARRRLLAAFTSAILTGVPVALSLEPVTAKRKKKKKRNGRHRNAWPRVRIAPVAETVAAAPAAFAQPVMSASLVAVSRNRTKPPAATAKSAGVGLVSACRSRQPRRAPGVAARPSTTAGNPWPAERATAHTPACTTVAAAFRAHPLMTRPGARRK
jgi:hypothetical protein